MDKKHGEEHCRLSKNSGLERKIQRLTEAAVISFALLFVSAGINVFHLVKSSRYSACPAIGSVPLIPESNYSGQPMAYTVQEVDRVKRSNECLGDCDNDNDGLIVKRQQRLLSRRDLLSGRIKKGVSITCEIDTGGGGSGGKGRGSIGRGGRGRGGRFSKCRSIIEIVCDNGPPARRSGRGKKSNSSQNRKRKFSDDDLVCKPFSETSRNIVATSPPDTETPIAVQSFRAQRCRRIPRILCG